jgi:secondary thiamine-phosphate synthase enzyme
MSWFQKNFTLPARSRGSYLITDHVLSEVPEIRDYKVGMLNLFVQHTSCALSLNENWDDDVRADMSDALDRIAPTDRKGNLYRHSAEGDDDMPVCSVHIHVPVILGHFEIFWGLFLFPLFSYYLLVSGWSNANSTRLISNLRSLAPP